MRSVRKRWWIAPAVVVVGIVGSYGCHQTPVATSTLEEGPAPLRMPTPIKDGDCCDSYENSLTGGKIFSMYCSYCHSAPTLAERPFSNFQNVAAHMRVRANLTGKEYAKLVEFLRRYHDVPGPEGTAGPGPKDMFFGQPIQELKNDQAATRPDLPGGPRAGNASELSPGQPPPGSSPREAR
jgi:hypothetical protein